MSASESVVVAFELDVTSRRLAWVLDGSTGTWLCFQYHLLNNTTKVLVDTHTHTHRGSVCVISKGVGFNCITKSY